MPHLEGSLNEALSSSGMNNRGSFWQEGGFGMPNVWLAGVYLLSNSHGLRR